MNPIMLKDLIDLGNESRTMIKFNIFNGYEDPMELYVQNPAIVNTQWLFWRKKRRYFSVGDVAVCLLRIGHNQWLLTTIKKVTKELNVLEGINYEGTELSQYSQYFGRVILSFHKTFQTAVVSKDTIWSDLEVLQILPSPFDGVEFPGYENVHLSYNQLFTIIYRQKRDWIKALENQKAIYLITDTSNGKLYVGSATGENGMLLGRWTSYVNNGHGGNKELIGIVNKYGFDYIKENFSYSILENYNARVDKNLILKRESWWKNALNSRVPHGYNQN